jgi:hypothetical protein
VVEPARDEDISELFAMGGTIAELVEVPDLGQAIERALREGR